MRSKELLGENGKSNNVDMAGKYRYIGRADVRADACMRVVK